MQLPTGKYAGCKYWPAVLEAAKRNPRLRRLVENYDRTKHPACLNAIMDNADGPTWLAFYSR